MRRWPTKRYAHAHAQDMHTHKSPLSSHQLQANAIFYPKSTTAQTRAAPDRLDFGSPVRTGPDGTGPVRLNSSRISPNLINSKSFVPFHFGPRQAGSKQSNAVHIRISIQFETVHMKSAQGRFDSSIPSKQRAGELEYLPWSAHKMHKTGNGGPQKDMHIENIGHFGPTQMHTCTRSASEAHRGDRHAHDMG